MSRNPWPLLMGLAACQAPTEGPPDPTPWPGPDIPVLILDKEWPRFVVDWTVGSSEFIGETGEVPAFLRTGSDGSVLLGCTSLMLDSDGSEGIPRLQSYVLPPPSPEWATLPPPEELAVTDGLAWGSIFQAAYAVADFADLDGDGRDDILQGGYLFQTTKEGLLTLVAAQAWSAADLQPGDPRLPTWFKTWSGGTPPGVVGDVDGGGVVDFVLRSTDRLDLIRGEDFQWSGTSPVLASLPWSESWYLLPQRIGDLTGDGIDDLLLGTTVDLQWEAPMGASNPVFLVLWEGGTGLPSELSIANSTATFRPLVDNRDFEDPLHPGSGPSTIHSPLVAAAGDINGDGWPDLAIAAVGDLPLTPEAPNRELARDGAAVRVFWGAGEWSGDYWARDASALRDSEHWTRNQEFRPGHLIVADIDEDGYADILQRQRHGGVHVEATGYGMGAAALVWSGRLAANAPIGEENIDFEGLGREPQLAIVDWDDYPPADDPRALQRTNQMALGPAHLLLAAYSVAHADCSAFAIPLSVLGERLAEASVEP